MPGRYITVEGIDGSGGTTLAHSLAEELDAKYTKEPNDDHWVGQAVRRAMGEDLHPVTDTLLFMADRAEHLSSVVNPALERGETVVSDRGHHSTFAYQTARVSSATGIPRSVVNAWVEQCYSMWNQEPHLTIWVDTPVGVALKRKHAEEKWSSAEYLEQVRDRYRELSETRYSVVRVDGDQPPEGVLADALELVEDGP